MTAGKISRHCLSHSLAGDSSTLFNIFINDLHKLVDALCNPALFGDITMNCLLYADDLIVVSQSHAGLQQAMDKLEGYCTSWYIRINVSKTRFRITKGGKPHTCEITYQNDKIEQVTYFKYLGIAFCQDVNTSIARNYIY
jgi:hypothetical protein